MKGQVPKLDRGGHDQPLARIARRILSARAALRTNETAMTVDSAFQAPQRRRLPRPRRPRAPHPVRLVDEHEEVAVQETERMHEDRRDPRPAQHGEDVLKRRGVREQLDGRDAGRALEDDGQKHGDAPPLKEREDRDAEHEGLGNRDSSQERGQGHAPRASHARQPGQHQEDPARVADRDQRDRQDEPRRRPRP